MSGGGEVVESMREVCSGCNREIDIELCWCGQLNRTHPAYCDHPITPMGCECHLQENDETREEFGYGG